VKTLANKDKLLLSAQKYLEKGRITKAISCFEKVVKMDPKDSRCHLKVAELYAQAGDRNKAVEAYEEIAKFFLENNFSLKAIAVFKQILKLAPEKKELHRQLGQLNEQQGLIGNALSEYKLLVEYYQEEELISETLWALKKIAELSPKNISIRMKVAEYSFRLDAKDEAKKELDLILSVLQAKEDHPGLGQFYEFYLSLFPEEFDIELAAAKRQLSLENPQEGIVSLEKLRQKEPQNIKLLDALANGYAQAGDALKHKSALNELLNLCPDDLDLCQKCVQAFVAAGDTTGANELLEKWKDTFQAKNRISDLQDLYEKLAEEFPGEKKAEDVLSTIREIIKSHTDYSNGVDFGSFNRPSEEDKLEVTEVSLGLEGAPEISLDENAIVVEEESVSEEVMLGANDLVEDDSGSLPTFDEAESFILETSAEAGSFKVVGSPAETLDDASGAAENDDLNNVFENVESQPSDESMEFEDSFFDFDLSDESSDLQGHLDGPDLNAELEEADFYLRQGLLDEAERVCNSILENSPDFQEAKSKLVEIEEKRSESASRVDGGNVEGGSIFSADNLSIDAFSQQGEEDIFLDGLIADSQKGVKTVIGQEDTESHFNLGIAYKEMGQFTEAITEFEQAQVDPVRFVDCITLIANCMVEKGASQEAEKVFADALKNDISEDDRLILNFEMGLLYSDQGKFSEALDKFHFVLNLDPFYRDVGERVKKLQESLGAESVSQPASSHEMDESLTENGRKNRVSYV
jgi:tetratricopeptide (TPR) repeat protein